ncbi:hypothetical protein [Micromonospora sp. ATCC 39149]|uniref:Uncharacterized protein n=1 Tax=Micromonospora carbonacea TaxID=47853 RepID=A0A7D6CG17_9ACTN|nr:hypothetical protein [Micromonospora sp. ATCC 39149]QLK00616.1 hypothetical protein HZU44_11740 [Micromonospora carbonacea]
MAGRSIGPIRLATFTELARAIWQSSDDLRGAPIESGHHVAQENPLALAAAVHHFLS